VNIFNLSVADVVLVMVVEVIVGMIAKYSDLG